MLTIEEATAHYRQWAAEHSEFASQVNEDQALTLYLAGMNYGIRLAMQRMGLTPVQEGDMTQ